MKKNIILAMALATAGMYSSCTWQPLTCNLTEAALSTDALVPVAVSQPETQNFIYQKGTQFYQPVTVQYVKDNGRSILRRSDHPTPNLPTQEEKAARFELSDTAEKATYYFPLTPKEVKLRLGEQAQNAGTVTYMGRIPVPAESFEKDESIKKLESLTAELPASCQMELPGDTTPCRLLSLKSHGEEPGAANKLLAVPATIVDLGVNAAAFAVEGTAMVACSIVYAPYALLTEQEQPQPETTPIPATAPTPEPEAKTSPAPEETLPALAPELQKTPLSTPEPSAPAAAPAPVHTGSPFLQPVAQPQPSVVVPTKL